MVQLNIVLIGEEIKIKGFTFIIYDKFFFGIFVQIDICGKKMYLSIKYLLYGLEFLNQVIYIRKFMLVDYRI